MNFEGEHPNAKEDGSEVWVFTRIVCTQSLIVPPGSTSPQESVSGLSIMRATWPTTLVAFLV